MTEAAADTAILVAAIITLVAISIKLVTTNLIARHKNSYASLEQQRRVITTQLKEVELQTTSARGTLEFWERRKTETALKVEDARRDFEAYVDQFGAEVEDDEEEEDTDTDDGERLSESTRDEEDELDEEPDVDAGERGGGEGESVAVEAALPADEPADDDDVKGERPSRRRRDRRIAAGRSGTRPALPVARFPHLPGRSAAKASIT